MPARTSLPKWPRPKPLSLSGVEPVSRQFGFERGKPVDRFYIERFLLEHSADVRGRVLEIAEPTYTQWYGGEDVTQSDVLHRTGVPEATIVGDLTTGEGIPVAAFDCFIATQTLHVIWDVPAAARGIRRALAPGGVALVTVPGMSQTSTEDRRDWGDWWRFTLMGAQRLFEEAFDGPAHVQARAHGNPYVASAFLYGHASEELPLAALEHDDPDFEFLITVRAAVPSGG